MDTILNIKRKEIHDITILLSIMVCVLSFVSCKLVDEFDPIRIIVAENTSPDNISVDIKRSKKKSDVVYINVTKEGGNLKLDCANLDEPVNFQRISIWQPGVYPGEDYDPSKFANEWMELRCKGKKLDFTFFPNIDVEEGAEITLGLGFSPNPSGYVIIRRIP